MLLECSKVSRNSFSWLIYSFNTACPEAVTETEPVSYTRLPLWLCFRYFGPLYYIYVAQINFSYIRHDEKGIILNRVMLKHIVTRTRYEICYRKCYKMYNACISGWAPTTFQISNSCKSKFYPIYSAYFRYIKDIEWISKWYTHALIINNYF